MTEQSSCNITSVVYILNSKFQSLPRHSLLPCLIHLSFIIVFVHVVGAGHRACVEVRRQFQVQCSGTFHLWFQNGSLIGLELYHIGQARWTAHFFFFFLEICLSLLSILPLLVTGAPHCTQFFSVGSGD